MSELKSIIEKIEKVKPVAEEVVEDGNPSTVGARRGRARSAKDALAELKRDYRNAVLRCAAFIVVTGPASAAFAKTAAGKSFECLAYPAEAFFDDLAGRVDERAYKGKDAGSYLFELVGRHLEDMGHQMDLSSYPMLVYSTKYDGPVDGRAALSKLLARAISEQVGSEIAAVYALNKAAAQAMADGYTGKTVPIILHTENQALARDISTNVGRIRPKAHFFLSAGESPAPQGAVEAGDGSEGSVKDALTAIKGALEGKPLQIVRTKKAPKADKKPKAAPESAPNDKTEVKAETKEATQ